MPRRKTGTRSSLAKSLSKATTAATPECDSNSDTPDGNPRMCFDSVRAFHNWLDENHKTCIGGIWLMIPKKDSGKTGPTYLQALDEALCYGWIDSQIRKYNDLYYIQKFTPRRKRSKWSKVNRSKVLKLIKDGRMKQSGLEQIEKAKEDGRWDAAYDSPSTITMPDEFQNELNKYPKAKEFYDNVLTKSNRFIILSQINDAKRDETRQRRINKYIQMCLNNEKPK